MNLDLAVQHLNASVGAVLTREQLAQALQEGSVGRIDSKAGALISSLFAEIDPALILRCAREAEADLLHVEHLYRESLADAMPSVPQWEQSVAHLL